MRLVAFQSYLNAGMHLLYKGKKKPQLFLRPSTMTLFALDTSKQGKRLVAFQSCLNAGMHRRVRAD